MVECFEMTCRHYPFKGKTVWCGECDVYKAKPTGKDCARCGLPIMVRRHEPVLLNYLCVRCSEEARKLATGLATDANILYCYFISTGRVMPWDFVKGVLAKSLPDLTSEETDFYERAKDGFYRLKGRHSMMGGKWLKD